MDLIYVLVYGNEWDDTVIITSEEDAIKESIKYPQYRIEIFSKNTNENYKPTYNYYKNGKYISNTEILNLLNQC